MGGKRRRETRGRGADAGEAEGPRRRLRSTLLALALLVAILYGTLLAVSRTAGFRALVEQRLDGAFGLAWRVDTLRLTPALALRFEGVEARAPGADLEAPPALLFREGELRADLRALLRGRLRAGAARARDGELRFTAGPEGWTPAGLAAHAFWADAWGGLGLDLVRPEPAPAAPAPEAAARPRAPAPVSTVGLDAFDVRWVNADGSTHAAIRGLRLEMTPLAAGDRHFTHIRLAAAAWDGARGEALRDVDAELLLHERRRWLLAFEAGG